MHKSYARADVDSFWDLDNPGECSVYPRVGNGLPVGWRGLLQAERAYEKEVSVRKVAVRWARLERAMNQQRLFDLAEEMARMDTEFNLLRRELEAMDRGQAQGAPHEQCTDTT